MGEIQKTEHYDLLVGKDGEGLASFFMPGEIDRAFRENEFAVSEMVETLTSIIRDESTRSVKKKDGSIMEEPVVSAREKMAAIRMLDVKAKEGMVLGGLIQNERLTLKKKLPDGTMAEYDAEGMKLVEEGSSRIQSTLSLLEEANAGHGNDIIDVEAIRSEPRDDGGNETGRRGAFPDPGPGDRGSNGGEPGCSGSGGAVVLGKLHGKERSSGSGTRVRTGKDDDKDSVKGAEDERGGGIPVKHGRGSEGKGSGENGGRDVSGDQCDPGPARRPIIPGESAVSQTKWYGPGIPRRAPGEQPDPSVRTAESIADRSARIARCGDAADGEGGDSGGRPEGEGTPDPGTGDDGEPSPGDGADSGSPFDRAARQLGG